MGRGEDYRIVVTEVAQEGSLRNVAGWDMVRESIVRPEPKGARFWPAELCGPETVFHPGHVVAFRGRRPGTTFPYRTEDVVVRTKPRRVARVAGEDLHAVLEKSLRYKPEEVFGRHLHFEGDRAFIVMGTQCGSLAAREYDADDVALHVSMDAAGDHLQAYLRLGWPPLKLDIAAKDLHQDYDAHGFDYLAKRMSRAGKLHVRFGLASPPANKPDHCYLQITGIYPV